MIIVECKKCKWRHFAVTRTEAETQVTSFNSYYESLSPESKRFYSGPSSVHDYEGCMMCDNKEFEIYTGKGRTGETLNPVIYEY